MRERVSDLGVEVAEPVGFYTRLVTELLAVVDRISVDSQDATIALQTNAYAAAEQRARRAGAGDPEQCVRARQLHPGAVTQFISLLAAQNTYLERFQAVASPASASC